MSHNSYCENCEYHGRFDTESNTETHTYRGLELTIDVELDVCPVCGDDQFDPSLPRRIEKQLEQMYQETLDKEEG